MTEKAQVAQLSVAKGTLLQESPFSKVLHHTLRQAEATLCILAESSPSTGEEASRLVIEAVEEEFRASRLSITACLTNAINRAHNRLLRENEGRRPEERVGVGLSCAVLRKSEVYLAQAGPALAYIVSRGQPTRLSTADRVAIPAFIAFLGIDEKVEVSLYREALQPGDTVILCSSTLSQAVQDQDLAFLDSLEIAAAQQALRGLAGDSLSYSALIIKTPLGVGEVVEAPAAVEPREEAAAPLEKVGEGLGLLAGLRSRLGRQRKAGLEAIREATKHFLPESEPAPQKGEPRAAGRTVAAPVVGRSRGQQVLLRALRLPLLLIALVLGVFLVSSAILYIPRYQESRMEQAFALALERAGRVHGDAVLAADPATARQQLGEAARLIDEALKLKEKEPRALALKSRIQEDLDRLNGVVRLTGLKTIVDIGGLPEGVEELTRLVVQSNNAYVLDPGKGWVHKFLLNSALTGLAGGGEDHSILVRKGDLRGGKAVEEIQEILYLPEGENRGYGSLVILDRNRLAMEYRPERGISLLTVRDAQAWASFTSALGYNGGLYILDAQGNQVWRYYPSATGFDSEMKGVLENADIGDAVDFAIDGDVYVLSASGRIQKFSSGRPEPFDQDGLDRPLSKPTAIFTSPDMAEVYVADAGNGRVVVFSKDGRFKRQLLGQGLDDLRDLQLSASSGLIHLLNGTKLMVASLPG